MMVTIMYYEKKQVYNGAVIHEISHNNQNPSEIFGESISEKKTGFRPANQIQMNFSKIYMNQMHVLKQGQKRIVCVSGGKKCSLFGKFGVLCFLETPALRFALLPYYRRTHRITIVFPRAD